MTAVSAWLDTHGALVMWASGFGAIFLACALIPITVWVEDRFRRAYLGES